MPPRSLVDLNDDVLFCIVDAIVALGRNGEPPGRCDKNFPISTTATLLSFASTCRHLRALAAKPLYRSMTFGQRPMRDFKPMFGGIDIRVKSRLDSLWQSKLLLDNVRQISLDFSTVSFEKFFACQSQLWLVLSNLNRITLLEVWFPDCEKQQLARICWSPRFEFPELVELWVDQFGIELALRCPKLRKLCLQRKDYSDTACCYEEDFEMIAKHLRSGDSKVKIEFLSLSEFWVEQGELNGIADYFADVEELDLANGDGVAESSFDAFLDNLAKLRSLRKLTIYRPHFPDALVPRYDHEVDAFAGLRECEFFGEAVFSTCASATEVSFKMRNDEINILSAQRNVERSLTGMKWTVFDDKYFIRLAVECQSLGLRMEDDMAALKPQLVGRQWANEVMDIEWQCWGETG